MLAVDRASAAPFSCVDQTIAWSSVSGSNPWTATAVSGSITITATITAVSTGTTEVYLSAGNVVQRMSAGHSIGDFFDTAIVFSDSSGTICQASTTVLDIDQNGRGLGCATTSRFRDELSNLSGPGLSVTPQGNLAEVSPGVYASTLNCKTTDTENLVMTWAVPSGVLSGGYRWTAATPPGTDPTLDLQLIKMVPFTVCATVAAGPAAVSSASVGGRGGGND